MSNAPPPAGGGPGADSADRTAVAEHEAYVPLAFARASLSKVTDEMVAMKTRHVDTLQEMGAEYRKVEEDTREHYVAFVRALQAKMRAALEAQAAARRAAVQQLTAEKAAAREREESLAAQLMVSVSAFGRTQLNVVGVGLSCVRAPRRAVPHRVQRMLCGLPRPGRLPRVHHHQHLRRR